MNFKCDRCGYENENRYLLKRHFERKYICEPKVQDISIDELKKRFDDTDKKRDFHCKFCNKGFTEASSMYRHQKHCSHVENQTVLNSDYAKLCEEFAVMKSQFSQMQQQISMQASSSVVNNNTTNNTTNNIQNTTNNINNIIVLRNFGNETHHHISDEFLARCVVKDLNGVKSLIEKIHFSEEAPENKNVRLKSSKRKKVEVFKGDNSKWEVLSAIEATETMINNGSRLLSAYFHNLDGPLDNIENNEELYERINKFLSEFPDKKSKLYQQLACMIYTLIENYRE
jgi:hypothetical protein